MSITKKNLLYFQSKKEKSIQQLRVFTRTQVKGGATEQKTGFDFQKLPTFTLIGWSVDRKTNF